jgi:hypothetical protein
MWTAFIHRKKKIDHHNNSDFCYQILSFSESKSRRFELSTGLDTRMMELKNINSIVPVYFRT